MTTLHQRWWQLSTGWWQITRTYVLSNKKKAVTPASCSLALVFCSIFFLTLFYHHPSIIVTIFSVWVPGPECLASITFQGVSKAVQVFPCTQEGRELQRGRSEPLYPGQISEPDIITPQLQHGSHSLPLFLATTTDTNWVAVSACDFFYSY